MGDLVGALERGEMSTTWVVIAPRFELPSGQLLGPGDVPIHYNLIQHRGGLSQLQLIPEYGGDYQADEAPGPVELLSRALAEAGHPIS